MSILGPRGVAPGLVVALSSCALAVGSPASRVTLSETEAKAAALYHLLHFTKWPAETFAEKDAPIIIGIIGVDPFGKLLDDLLQGESAQGRNLRIKRCTTVAEAAGCQMVFIGEGEGAIRIHTLNELRRAPILTVGDDEAFVREGGIVALVVRDQRIHILVNLEAARQANVVLSAKLLKLAEITKEHD